MGSHLITSHWWAVGLNIMLSTILQADETGFRQVCARILLCTQPIVIGSAHVVGMEAKWPIDTLALTQHIIMAGLLPLMLTVALQYQCDGSGYATDADCLIAISMRRQQLCH
jgi:hypothetical protein